MIRFGLGFTFSVGDFLYFKYSAYVEIEHVPHMLPISKVVQEEDIILQDTGFDLHFNQEKFELPEKDSWRFESFSTKSKKLSCLWI